MKQLTMTKVLTPLAALAFAFGVQAAAVSTDGFETETSTVVTNRTGWSFTYGTDGADDASAITAYDNNAPGSSLVPDGMTAGSNYLKLSTEDGMLFRTMNPASQDGAVAFDSALFVDTDVQFTITDPSDRPEVTSGADGDKFIIWLEANGSATNLCVWAREFTVANDAVSVTSNKVYKLVSAGEPVDIVAGSWHRLTVKALKAVGATYTFPAFQVFVDGVQFQADTEYIVDSAGELAFKEKVGDSVVNDQLYFPAMADSMPSLTKVGFSGEGAIDNVAVTKDIPGFLPHHKIAISWDTTAVSSVTLVDANTNEVATLTNSGDYVVVGPDVALYFDKENLGYVSGSASNWDFTDPADDDDWNIDGNVAPVLANGVISIPAANGDGSFTIVLASNNKCTFTLTASGYGDSPLDAFSAVSYAINSGTPVGLTEDDIDALANGLEIECEFGDVITFTVTASGYTASLTAGSGGTVSGMAFTVGQNQSTAAAEIVLAAQVTVATVNGHDCYSFAEALAYVAHGQAGEGYPIVLADDIALDGVAAIADGDNVTIDLAGNTIAGASGAAATFSVASGGTLNITNSTGTGYVNAGSATACISNAGTLNIWAGNFGGTISGSVNVNGGFFDAEPANAICPTGKVIGTPATTEDVNYPYGLVDEPVARIVGGSTYTTLKDAIDAAQAGDTVIVLANCTVAEAITFNYGITVSNDYTVTLSAAYALRIFNGTSSDVTFCGSGTYLSTGTGSPVLVGNNEDKSSYNVDGTPSGRMVLASGTIKRNDGSNNMIKVENGKFVMNDGSLLGGSRGVKADADAGSFTSEVIVNGGVITNGATAAVAASRGSATGTATVTINGGDITGKIVKGANTTLTIPGTSTARFDRDQSSFCETGYETTQSGDWYVVTAVSSGYPTYVGEDATLKSQYDTWKATYGDDTGSAYESAFLLNVAPTGDTTLDATAVTISGTTVTITIDHATVNGYPYVKTAATLEGLKTATPVAATVGEGGVITLPNQSGAAAFYKVGVSATPIQ